MGIFWFWESPTTGWHACKVKKHFHFLIYHHRYHHAWPSLRQTDTALCAHICQWIARFLTDRQQLVRLGKLPSRTLTSSTGAPQGCVFSPLLFSLYTNDCTSKDPSVKLLKSADNTTVIGIIKDGDESAYRQEVEQLAVWCSLNNLELNTLITLEMIVDFRRNLLYCEKGPAEAVFPPPAKEVQPATGAAETVLLCHHRDCPVFIYNCLVWFSNHNRHQRTTTDCQDCWADYRYPSAQPPRTLHLQSEEQS